MIHKWIRVIAQIYPDFLRILQEIEIFIHSRGCYQITVTLKKQNASSLSLSPRQLCPSNFPLPYIIPDSTNLPLLKLAPQTSLFPRVIARKSAAKGNSGRREDCIGAIG